MSTSRNTHGPSSAWLYLLVLLLFGAASTYGVHLIVRRAPAGEAAPAARSTPTPGAPAHATAVPTHGPSLAPVSASPTPSGAPAQLTVDSGSPPLTAAQYDAIRQELFGLVDRQDPRAALNRLSVLMSNPSVLRSCHALVHEIGHEAYRKYRDFATAVRYQDDLCGSGYLHGVVEERFAQVSDVYAEMRTICNAYIGTNILGMCYHGVGHGLMSFTNNNLPMSLQMCSGYPTTMARIRCSEGVFMENFNTDRKVHRSAYLDVANPIYPCPQQSQFYKGSCYYYAPIFYLSLHDRDFAGALRWCDTAEWAFRTTCASGVGSRIMKQNIANPAFVERTCAAAGGARTDACIDGMVSYYLVNFNSMARGRALCAAMQLVHQAACYRALDARSANFAN